MLASETKAEVRKGSTSPAKQMVLCHSFVKAYPAVAPCMLQYVQNTHKSSIIYQEMLTIFALISTIELVYQGSTVYTEEEISRVYQVSYEVQRATRTDNASWRVYYTRSFR